MTIAKVEDSLPKKEFEKFAGLEMFDGDSLTAYRIPESESWYLGWYNHQDDQFFVLENAKGALRTFKTLDAAYTSAYSMGFMEMIANWG